MVKVTQNFLQCGAEYIRMGIQYSLVNIVWGTASTGSYGGSE